MASWAPRGAGRRTGEWEDRTGREGIWGMAGPVMVGGVVCGRYGFPTPTPTLDTPALGHVDTWILDTRHLDTSALGHLATLTLRLFDTRHFDSSTLDTSTLRHVDTSTQPPTDCLFWTTQNFFWP
ncbi:hypothetical protein PMIN06_008459 [Paraphaeosphaeria minitans]